METMISFSRFKMTEQTN